MKRFIVYRRLREDTLVYTKGEYDLYLVHHDERIQTGTDSAGRPRVIVVKKHPPYDFVLNAIGYYVKCIRGGKIARAYVKDMNRTLWIIES